MEGQGVSASAASEAGRHGEPGAGAIAAADLDDPGVTHATSDTTDGGEGQRRNGDDTLVIPALGRPEVNGSSSEVPFAGPAEWLPQPPRACRFSGTAPAAGAPTCTGSASAGATATGSTAPGSPSSVPAAPAV